MIRFLTLHNFKCFNDAELSLKNLTLVTGKNAAGKSTVLQSLLLLKQSYEMRYLQDGQLCFSEQLVDLEDYASTYSNEPDVEDGAFYIVVEDEDDGRWAFTVDEGETGGKIVACHSEQSKPLSECPLFDESMLYLNAERLGPRTSHVRKTKRSRLESRVGDIHGDGAVSLFYDSIDKPLPVEGMRHVRGGNDLAGQINAWMNEILGQETILSADADPSTIYLKYGLMNGEGVEMRVSPTNTAFGHSYVFPIVVAVMTAPAGSLILLENPEAHLHPAAQVKMGRFLSLAAANGIQLLVETHSDHLLNGIRLSVCHKTEWGGGVLSPGLTNVYYFEEDEGQAFRHRYREIEINEDGKLSDWPKDFMDAW